MPSAYQSCLKEVDMTNIRVSMISQQVLGDAGSISPVLSNPRVFVMDSKKNLTMPMILAEEKKTGENCNIRYDGNGTEIGRDCYPDIQQIVSFAGLKQFSLSTTEGIKEIFSYDEKAMFEQKICNSYYHTVDSKEICLDFVAGNTTPDKIYSLSPWSINNYSMRVGYAGDALFFFHEDFAHFMLPGSNGSGTYIDFK